MLQSQDFIFSVLSGQVVWSRCLTSKWQVNKEMEIIGEVGGRGRKNRKGRITAWRSSGVPRGVLSGKSASLKVACKCCYLRGMFLHLCQPWVGRDTLEQGFQWLAGQYNKFEWKLEKTYERWLGLNLLTLKGIPGGSSLPALSSGKAEGFGLCPSQKAGGGIVLAIWAGHTGGCGWGYLECTWVCLLCLTFGVFFLLIPP